MMTLKIGEIVCLEENREYTTISVVSKDNYQYAYLVTTEEPYKVKFVKIIPNEEDINLEIVQDQNKKEELLNLFQKELNKIYL